MTGGASDATRVERDKRRTERGARKDSSRAHMSRIDDWGPDKDERCTVPSSMLSVRLRAACSTGGEVSGGWQRSMEGV